MTANEALATWIVNRIGWRLTNMTRLGLQCLAGQIDPEECRLRMIVEHDHLAAGVDELASVVAKAFEVNTPVGREEDSEDVQ